MATALVVKQGEALEHAATPMEMIALAISQNADIEKLAKLMDLQERWERNEARKAFVAAMAEFKANPPKLEKVKHVNFSSKSGSSVDYHYAPLDYVGRIMGEALSKHGLSYRWSATQGDGNGPVSVTCVLQHSQGHSESVTLTAAIHDDQRMNPIQRLGATISYLQRYTLLSATGMATENQDLDGGGPTNGELLVHLESIASAPASELDAIFRDAFAWAKNQKAAKAMLAIVTAKDNRKKELAKQ
jgi:ERF superfamily